MIHGDVRLDHVLLHEGLVKLGGFDSSQSYSDDNGYANKAGMPMFCAPEVLGKQPNHLANMWSLGVSLAVLLTGKIPFTSEGIPVVAFTHEQDHSRCLPPCIAQHDLMGACFLTITALL